jgi:hypothetical protein
MTLHFEVHAAGLAAAQLSAARPAGSGPATPVDTVRSGLYVQA